MHNRIGFNRLGRKSSHRNALHRNMVTSLIKYGRIKTTCAKAKEIRRTTEKLITRAKVDSVHNRRIAARTIYEKDVLNKLFVDVSPKFSDRPGGYTRVLKLGYRDGDAAEMVLLEFVGAREESTETETPSKSKKSSKTKSSSSEAKVPKKSKEAPVETDLSKTAEPSDKKEDTSVKAEPSVNPENSADEPKEEKKSEE